MIKLEAQDATSLSIMRFEGQAFPAQRLVYGLDQLGWNRGTELDEGGIDECSKQFPGADVTAIVNYDGATDMGYFQSDEIFKVTGVWFVKGMRHPSRYAGPMKKNALPLKKVHPIVVSEVVGNLNGLRLKDEATLR